MSIRVVVLCVVLLQCYHTRAVFGEVLKSLTEYAPVVNITGGQVRGLLEVAENGHRVHLYQGIKYGQANRFERPQKHSASWSKVYDATSLRYACPQPNIAPSDHSPVEQPLTARNTKYSNEDCLYLNVFRSDKSSEDQKRAVMVWIHGGTFISGSCFDKAFDSRYIATMGDVVVVTVNYRLGAFGFLLGDDHQYPGNLGLYDQILALQWVQENIRNFGGDPNQVTLFGESAGAMAVGCLVLSPLAKGLFHRVIMQSGAPNSFVGSESRTSAQGKVKFLASFLDCQRGNLSDTVQCIHSKSTEQIQNVVNTMGKLGQFFEPSYGTELLPLSPVEALKTGKLNQNLDLLYGVNRDEGATGVYGLFDAIRPNSGKTISVNTVRDDINVMVQVFRLSLPGEVADWYTRHLNDSDQVGLRNAVANVYGDYNLVCPTILFGEQYARHSPGNKFYSYRLVQPLTNGWGECESWMGVCHAMDLNYVFGMPIAANATARYSHNDYRLSRDIITAWTAFANSGNPGQMGSIQWTPAFELEHTNHGLQSHRLMWLDASQYQMVTGYFTDLCEGFWKAKLFA